MVDDNISFLETVSLYLEKNGYQVTKASSIPDALLELKKKSFEFVITDLRVGQRSGAEIMDYLSAHKEKTALIAMTAFIDDSNLARICNFARVILVKPFPLQDLSDALSQPQY